MNTDISALEILAKIFDAESSIIDETKIFSGISHDDLCSALEYWVDQCKLLFGEPVVLYQNQSLRDAGVDVSVNLLSSNIKFGIQVKSHGDIEENDFTKNVKMQITDSAKHKISRFILAFAGDLTNNSQSQKVRGLISELGQRGTNEILVIPPEKLVTIYKAYAEKKHPLQFVALDLKEGIKIAQGIGKSLSNEKRSVSVEFKIDYKYNIDYSKYTKKIEYTIQLDQNELDFLDNFEKMHDMNKILTIPKEKFTKFKIFDNGKEIDDLDHLQYVKIIPEFVEEYVTLTAFFNPTQSTPILNNARFIRRQFDSGAQIILQDPRYKALRFEFVANEKIMNMRIAVNFANSDVYDIQKAIDLFESLKQAKTLDLKSQNKNIGLFDIDLENQNISEVDPYYKKLVSSLILISELTGTKFTFPDKLKEIDSDRIIDIAQFFDKRSRHQKGHLVKLLKNDAIRMITKYNENKITDSDTMLIKYDLPVLGQKIRFDAIIPLSKYRPKENVGELLDKIKKSNDKVIEFDVLAINEENNLFLQPKKTKK